VRVVDPFPLAGMLRRIRRIADCSQRELAQRLDMPKGTLAAAETGTRELPVSMVARAASLIGGRLAVLDASGEELRPMDRDAVRDAAGRLFPAHLDTRHGDEHWWGGEHRPRLRQPRYTFHRDRSWRDGRRHDGGTPEDHHTPRPGDSLTERRAQRRAEAQRRREEEFRRRREAGELPLPTPEWTCECPPECAELDIGERPRHAQDCPCRCDVD
jgi:transcriptional regulator with XRE-family HTH domain